MLERPMLLLNPWAVRSTETAEQLAQPQAPDRVLGQGYHLPGPLPANELGPLLAGPAASA